MQNIRARAHFLVLLTPSVLERCGEPGDWLRREIEIALDSRRNIVPLLLEDFDFSSPAIASQLTGKLSTLKHYNALRVPVDFFPEAMDRLRERFLNVPLDAVLHPASGVALQSARDHQAAAQAALAVQRLHPPQAEPSESRVSAPPHRESLFVFLSYASEDRPAVERIPPPERRRLRKVWKLRKACQVDSFGTDYISAIASEAA